MEYSKQTVIDGLKRTVEKTEARIVELSEPCVNQKKSKYRSLWRIGMKNTNML